jgi:hypothetical protein
VLLGYVPYPIQRIPPILLRAYTFLKICIHEKRFY